MLTSIIARGLAREYPCLDALKRAIVAPAYEDAREGAFVLLWVPDPQAEYRLEREVKEILARRASLEEKTAKICESARVELQNSIQTRLNSVTLADVLARLKPRYRFSRVTASGHKPSSIPGAGSSRFRVRRLDPNRHIPVPGILACVDGSTIMSEKGTPLPGDWLINDTFKIDNERAWRVRRGLPAENLEIWDFIRRQKKRG